MRPDPLPRDDGRCARAGCRNKVKRTRQTRRYAGDAIDREPFCSSECCRKFHGCELAVVGSAAAHEGGRRAREIARDKAGYKFVDEMSEQLLREVEAEVAA